MSTKPAPRCPGCGKEMEMRWQSYYGGIDSMWYTCACGWRSPDGDDETEAYDKAMQRYAENPWISVKDRMPEQDQKYVARCINGIITHWMPLPEPPEGGRTTWTET